MISVLYVFEKGDVGGTRANSFFLPFRVSHCSKSMKPSRSHGRTSKQIFCRKAIIILHVSFTMTSHRGYLLLAACILLRGRSWGFQFGENRKVVKHSPLREKWTSSSRNLLSPPALLSRNSDIAEEASSRMADDDGLHDTIEVMASFLTLRVGMVVLRRQMKKQKGQALWQEATHIKEKQLQSPVNKLEALESTVEDIRIARANKLEATWKAAERAVVKNMERKAAERAEVKNMERRSILFSSVGTTPVECLVDEPVTSSWSAVGDVNGERHSPQHKKEGDPSSNATTDAVVLSAAGDDVVLTAPSNDTTTNNSDLGDAVLGMFFEIIKDGFCLLRKAAESSMSQPTLPSTKHARQSMSTQSPIGNQVVPKSTIGSASTIPATFNNTVSAKDTTVKANSFSPRGNEPGSRTTNIPVGDDNATTSVAEKLVTPAIPTSYSPFGKKWGPSSTIASGVVGSGSSTPSSVLDKLTADVVSSPTTPSSAKEKLITTAKPASYLSFGKKWEPISTIAPGATDALTSTLSSILDKLTADVVSATPFFIEKLVTATKLASYSPFGKKWGPSSTSSPVPDPLTDSVVATLAGNVTTTPPRYSTFATLVGPGRTDAPFFLDSSPRTLTTVAAQASCSPVEVASSYLDKNGLSAAIGPAAPTTSSDPRKQTADTSSPIEKEWKPGQLGVLPYFADRKPKSRYSFSRAEPAPVAPHPTNYAPSENELGSGDKVPPFAGHSDGSTSDPVAIEAKRKPSTAIAPAIADPVASTGVPDIRKPAPNKAAKLVRYSPFGGRWESSKTFDPPSARRTPSVTAAFKTYPPFECKGSSSAKIGFIAVMGPDASNASSFTRQPAADTAAKPESYLRSGRTWTRSKAVAAFPYRSIPNSTAVRVEYSTVENKSSPLDGQFDVLPVLIEEVGAPSTDDVVSRSITPRAVDSPISAEAKKSSDETKQRAILVARLEQDECRKDRSLTEAKQRALLAARLEQDQRRKDGLDTEVKQRALLVARLEQDQRLKDGSATEAKQRALSAARREQEQLLQDRSDTEANQRALLTERFEQDQRSKHRSDTEAKHRAFLAARIEQDQRRKDNSDTEAKHLALLVARIEQDQWPKDRSHTEVKQQALLAARLEQDQRRKDGSDTEVKQRALLVTRLEQGQLLKCRSDTEAKQRALLAARLEQEQLLKARSETEASNTDTGRPFDSIPSQASQISSSSSVPFTHVEPAMVATKPSKYSPFQKNWGPSSTVGSVVSYSPNTIAVAAATAPVTTITSSVRVTDLAADDLMSKLIPVVQAKPIVSWKERMIAEAKIRDTIGLSRARDVVASKNVVTTSTQNESTVAADAMETKGFDTVELNTEQSLNSKFLTPPDPALVVQAKPIVSWKERMISEAKIRDTIGLSRARGVVASKNEVISSTQNESTVAADPMEAKGFDAVAPEVTSPLVEPTPVTTKKSNYLPSSVGKKWGPISTVHSPVPSSADFVSTAREVLAETTDKTDTSKATVTDSVTDDLIAKYMVTPSDPAPVVQARPSVSWKERVIEEAKIRDTPGLWTSPLPLPRTKAQSQPSQWKEKNRFWTRLGMKTRTLRKQKEQTKSGRTLLSKATKYIWWRERS
jgi:hypothetical protein